MLKSRFVWNEREDVECELVRSTLHPEVERLFLERGLGPASELFPDQETELIWHDPFKFKEMKTAVERIKQAVSNKESILVYGDYDADGVTSTAILIRALSHLKANANFYIPHRFYEGYGPNEDAFMQAIGEGYGLVITVDCGIAGVAEAALLKEHGVDLIIIDHHQPKEEIPHAVAIIHPEYDDDYPFNALAGAGVTLKVAEALRGGLLEDDDYMLAAFGTIGDVVDLVNENRSIVKRGLAALKKTMLPGVLALLRQAEMSQYEADARMLGFMICPRLNAPGRMDDASIVVHLLLAEDELMAEEYAREVESMNDERKAVTDQITDAAIKLAEAKELDKLKVLVLYQPDWHEGVLGIVASKIGDKYAKSVVVLTDSDEEGVIKGSARAPEGLDILSALVANEHLLARYGGHERAAGLSLANSNPDELEAGLNDAFKESDVVAKHLTVDINMTIKNLDFKWLDDVDYLAPFGQGNKRPTLRLAGVKVKNVKRIGAARAHLKLTLHQGKHAMDAVFFHGAHTLVYLTPDATFDVLCDVEMNEWNGNKKLQARVIDIKCDDIQLLDLRNPKLDAEFSPLINDAFTIDTAFESKEMLRSAYVASGAKDVVLKKLPPLTMPDRRKFTFVYKTVKRHAPFRLHPEIVAYFEKNNIPKAMLVFIVRVFTEVGLFTYEEGLVALTVTNEKVDYKTATSYRTREAKVAAHEFLELGTTNEILSYLLGGV